MHTLAVQARKTGDSNEALREKGLVPAVFYGPKEKSTAVFVDSKSLERVFKEAGETSIVKLSGVGEEKDTLIHDVQFHPVTGSMLHADFYVIEKGKKITIKIPLEFVGTAPAEKLGHIVVKAMHEVEIEVAPAELPRHLEVDISGLADLTSRFLVKDIKLPPSAVMKTGGEEIVVAITEFKEEKESTPVIPAEIIGEKKPEGEAAAAPEAKKEEKK
ncbi:MAG: hypothetical protein RL235_1087 [Chlamydiota bacterium]|jgi:large subunit ribosomal protein L25